MIKLLKKVQNAYFLLQSYFASISGFLIDLNTWNSFLDVFFKALSIPGLKTRKKRI